MGKKPLVAGLWGLTIPFRDVIEYYLVDPR